MNLTIPPKAEWAWSFTPDFSFQVQQHKAPNWFHRLMLRVVFGIHWRKIT